MNYYLYKLSFTTPVHFGESDSARSLATSGMNFCADTLFSALCCTLAESGRAEEIDELCGMVRENRLLLSDAFPYCGTELYIPRPLAAAPMSENASSTERKTMKKLKYIPLTMWKDYIDFLTGNSRFEVSKAERHFGESLDSEKVSLTDSEKSEPYNVGLFSFNDGCGLYGVIGYESSAELCKCLDLLRLTGLGGIGGKRTVGYGKYDVCGGEDLTHPAGEGEKILGNMLCGSFERWMLITAALPRDEELDEAVKGASFKLVRRGGFEQSTSSATPQKKMTQYFFCAGSVFAERFGGDLYRVGSAPAYRYAKPVFLGVEV